MMLPTLTAIKETGHALRAEYEVLRHGLLLKRVDQRPIPKSCHEIRLYCKVHNERRNLEWFIPYYRNLGVERFFIVDDDSTDGTL